MSTPQAIACIDVGSTFTKGVLVEVGSGRLVASAESPTTVGTDVMEGLDAVRVKLRADGHALDETLVCSSAGGGLRIAVVGYEPLVTAEAGHRVALSAGGKVVHVTGGKLVDLTALNACEPDVVLLVGGTDGGNAEVLLHNARVLGQHLAPSIPVVVAGNIEVRDAVCDLLDPTQRLLVSTANVLPRIGVLDAEHTRSAIREVFLRHVIGGKGLSQGPEFAHLVRAATPDAVLTGVELLADGAGDVPGAGDVLVVDVGGATTDVYSVITPDAETTARHRDVVEVLWRARTVEGDLGMRWGALGAVAAARAEGLDVEAPLEEAARRRVAEPGWLPSSGHDRDEDARLATLAVTVALRRHGRGGRELRHVRRVIGSGGVLRHADAQRAREILASATSDFVGGWQVPEYAEVHVDLRYVLAAAGLLSRAGHRETGARLLRSSLP